MRGCEEGVTGCGIGKGSKLDFFSGTFGWVGALDSSSPPGCLCRRSALGVNGGPDPIGAPLEDSEA